MESNPSRLEKRGYGFTTLLARVAPAFFDIRYPAGYPVSFARYLVEYPARKNCFKLRTKDKITSKHIPEYFQYAESKSEIAIRSVSRFC